MPFLPKAPYSASRRTSSVLYPLPVRLERMMSSARSLSLVTVLGVKSKLATVTADSSAA